MSSLIGNRWANLKLHPTSAGLSLNISEVDNSLNLDPTIGNRRPLRGQSRQSKLHDEVTNAVFGWRDVAGELRISRGEQEAMATRFPSLKTVSVIASPEQFKGTASWFMRLRVSVPARESAL